jgi:hypothetical protein
MMSRRHPSLLAAFRSLQLQALRQLQHRNGSAHLLFNRCFSASAAESRLGRIGFSSGLIFPASAVNPSSLLCSIRRSSNGGHSNRSQNKELGETTLLMQEGTDIQEVPVAVLRSDPCSTHAKGSNFELGFRSCQTYNFVSKIDPLSEIGKQDPCVMCPYRYLLRVDVRHFVFFRAKV